MSSFTFIAAVATRFSFASNNTLFLHFEGLTHLRWFWSCVA